MNPEKINLSLFGESGGEAAAPSSTEGAEAQADTPSQPVGAEAKADAKPQEGVENRASDIFIDYLCGSAEIRAENPAFELRTAMSDPAFLELFRQGVGFKEAYLRADMASRYPQIASRRAMEAAAGKLFNAIKSNRRRPTENGTQQGSAAVTKRDVSQLTKEERKDIIRRVQSGEKISFN